MTLLKPVAIAFIILLVILIVLFIFSAIAEGYKTAHQQELALATCGNQESISKVTTKSFVCADITLQKVE
jgi:hypothetical protein